MTEELIGIREKSQYIPGQDLVLRTSQEKEQEPYKTNVLGKEFWVLPDVFSPKYYAETAFYTQHVVDILKPGDDYLDMGCGVGVTAVMAALKGAKVTALDINPIAIENTRKNVVIHNVNDKVKVLQSDIYQALRPEERFDVIYWNIPFGFRKEGTKLTPLEEAVYDPGYRKHKEFIMGAKSHLKPRGRLLAGVSSTLGNLEAIEKFAQNAGIKFEQIAEMIDPDAPYEIKFQLVQAEI